MEEEVIKDAVLEILNDEIWMCQVGEFKQIEGQDEAAEKIAKYIHSLLKSK